MYMIGKQKQNLWNVPNVLTMVRMALIPVYWVLILNGMPMKALAVYVVASLTDVVDGYIARKYNLITDFGKLMDPTADKLMVISVMLSMVITDVIPLAPFVILAAKEFLMMVGAACMLGKGQVVFAKWSGKLAQTVVVTSLVLCFFSDYFMSIGFPLHLYLIWVGVGLALYAFGYYVRMSIKILRESDQKAA